MQIPSKLKPSLQTIVRAVALALVVLLGVPRCTAYSVLTHEQVVDLAWRDTLVPMLLARFPKLTPEQLKEAHSYAYGGCVLQDMGYYPHGSHYFSNLLHYVRTGEFVVALLKNSQTPDEYAFALGALAHYAGDTTGHPAVNTVTGMIYPKLAAKYGSSVTYDDDPTAHVRVEFGFDVVEVAKGRYQVDDYRNFIGFNVSKDLLDRAFLDAYGLPLKDVLTDEDANINSYRRDVSVLIPKMTRVAWASYSKDIQKDQPTATERRFEYRMSKVEYEKNFGKGYQKPSAGAHIVAFFVRILPKIGPLKALQVKMPDAKEQDILLKSVNSTLDRYHTLLHDVSDSGAQFQSLYLPEMDFDTGRPTHEGEYQLTDQTYAQLLLQFESPAGPKIPADIRDDILSFYSDPTAKDWVRIKNPQQWARVQAALATLKATPPVAPVAAPIAAPAS